MTHRKIDSRLWIVAGLISLLVSGCLLPTEEGNNEEEGTGDDIVSSDEGDELSFSGDVLPGDPCDTDEDCEGNARCLDSIIPGDRGYCAPVCETHDDCAVFYDAETFYYYEIPESVVAGNKYNSRYLDRGIIGCVDPAEHPELGEADGNSYCAYLCPLNAAARVNDAGDAWVGCSCLPNYRAAEADEGVLDCVWDEETECSIFRACTVENTDVHECSTGNFQCVVDDGLEGTCFDFLNLDYLEACVFERCSSSNCDTGCLQSCGGTPECVDACCSC